MFIRWQENKKKFSSNNLNRINKKMNLRLFIKNSISMKSRFQLSQDQKMTKNQLNILDKKLKHLNRWNLRYLNLKSKM